MTHGHNEPFQMLDMWAQAVERQVVREHRLRQRLERLADPVVVSVLALVAVTLIALLAV